MKMKKGYYLASYNYEVKGGIGFGQATTELKKGIGPEEFLILVKDQVSTDTPTIDRERIVIIAVSKLA